MGKLRIEPATGTVPVGAASSTAAATGATRSRVGYAWSDTKKVVGGTAGLYVAGGALGAAVPPVGAVEVTLLIIGAVGSGLAAATGFVGLVSDLFAPAQTNQQVHQQQPLTSLGGIWVDIANAVRGAPPDDEAARVAAEEADKVIDLLKTLSEPSKLVETAEKASEKIEQTEGWGILGDWLKSPDAPENKEDDTASSDTGPEQKSDNNAETGRDDNNNGHDDNNDTQGHDSNNRDNESGGDIDRAGNEDRLFFA